MKKVIIDQRLKNYAFIDSQNLYLGILGLGWKIDYKKFRVYLKEKDKLARVLAPCVRNCSVLLRKAAGSDIAFVADLKNKLEHKKKNTP